MTTTKQVAKIYEGAQTHMVGDGFRVQNLFPNGNRSRQQAAQPLFPAGLCCAPAISRLRQSPAVWTSTRTADLKR